jgi:hypothetical protein
VVLTAQSEYFELVWISLKPKHSPNTYSAGEQVFWYTYSKAAIPPPIQLTTIHEVQVRRQKEAG